MESRFGKFRLVQRIGGGKLSQVFSVTRQEIRPGPRARPLTTRVALKRVNPALIGEPAFVQLVVREAGVLTRLSHPGLVQCHELGVVDGCAFLTLKLVQGCTLRALLRRVSSAGIKLPASSILALGFQLAQVLDYLHGQGSDALMHLDLSPQNVMLARDGRLKLIDFGIARYLDGHDPPPLEGRFAGTVGYMSPEQARGELPDARADQFGLGILLWEMLAGARLFRGNNPNTWQRMRAGQVPPPQQALRQLPTPVVQLVYRLLQPQPEQRFADPAEVLAAFELCSSSPPSGKRSLAALVQRLMRAPDFDPFDVVQRARDEAPDDDIPSGEGGDADYDELSIEVDQGLGSPAQQLRAVLPDEPDSPFLEEG